MVDEDLDQKESSEAQKKGEKVVAKQNDDTQEPKNDVRLSKFFNNDKTLCSVMTSSDSVTTVIYDRPTDVIENHNTAYKAKAKAQHKMVMDLSNSKYNVSMSSYLIKYRRMQK